VSDVGRTLTGGRDAANRLDEMVLQEADIKTKKLKMVDRESMFAWREMLWTHISRAIS
jgi:hypothetical protein